MKPFSKTIAFLLVGISPERGGEEPALSALVTEFENRDWPVAFLLEPGAQLPQARRPRPGDLVIQTHCASLAREPAFINLFKDFGEPNVVIAGDWDRDFLIATVVDCFLSGAPSALALDACQAVRSGNIGPLSVELRDLLGGFSYALKAADLQETERSRWF